ncbi:hypothetical protein MKW94_001821 [Papaver nudicaule]|uniref:TraB domain-containing protein n=1 Tax=Papaver nudicaule TaxID=74823 RepID=A0AA41V3F3_PAPNU|nr:hypothetical protein [Papaver nudicaule]
MSYSTILNRLVRVSTVTTQRAGGHCSYLLQHVKWCHDQTHYQHGIPGIPTNGKVVLLKNSNTGSQVYLVGTNHTSKESPQIVKKVINSIRPDAIAIELPKEDMEYLRRKNWEPGNVNEDWRSMFLRSVRSPGGLLHKIIELRINWHERRLQANGIILLGELKVALEESLKLKAKLVPIDHRDVDFNICIYYHSLLWRSIPYFIELLKIKSIVHLMDKDSRSQIRVINRLQRISTPEFEKVMIDDRNMHMCTRLRRMEEKLIVAVVGMRHMDGIELLWKHAEDVINSIRPDAIAIELSKDGIKAFENWKPVNVNEDWFSMFLRSMRSPGGLLNKMIRLINNIDERRLLADGIINGGEFEVAMEECRKLKAKLVPIDQDADYPISIPLKNCLQMGGAEIKAQIMGYFMDEGSRSQTREHMRPMRLYAPELYQAKVEDRDIHMFTRLRRMEEKLIVGVVGMGHMDGIELLWKRAEDGHDDKLLPSTSENGGVRSVKA